MRQDGVYGPYRHRNKWRLCVREGGAENFFSYGSEEEAQRVKRAYARKLATKAGQTVGEALTEYEKHLQAKGNKPGSVATTLARLRRFFADLDNPIRALTPKGVAALYGDLVGEQKPDTHRNTLAEARTFFRWAVKRGIVPADLTIDLQGQGRRSRGKDQLRIDEARLWMARALELAGQGEAGAVAALVSLLMGLRAGEIVAREVRDLDDRGRILWIPDSKTSAGRRVVEVPAVLRPHLLALTEGKGREAPLFGSHWRDWPREWVQRICRMVSVPVVTAHGMRGLHASLATAAGVSGHAVAASLGHESPAVTMAHYADRSSQAAAQVRQVTDRLAGHERKTGNPDD